MRIDKLNINHDELVDMALLQGDAIQILIEKVEKLKTGIDKLEKNLTDKIDQLEKRADILVLIELRERLKEQEDALADYQAQYLETEAEWITEGWCEALTFVIKKIEGRMKDD